MRSCESLMAKMWLLAVTYATVLNLVSVHSQNINNNTPVFRKCCDKTQSLVKIVINDVLKNTSVRYECIEQEDGEEIYKVTVSPLYIDKNVLIVPGVADCDEVEAIAMTDANTELLVSQFVCYDRLVLELNGNTTKPVSKTIALKCPHNESDDTHESSVKIQHIRKCCPENQEYDREFHICRTTEAKTNYNWLIEKMDSKEHVYEVEAGLNCKGDEYAVELSDEMFYFSVKGSTLSVMGRNGESGGQVAQSDWCMDRDHETQGMMASVCTRDCSAYDAFCMRKCCPIGQHFKPKRCGAYQSVCVPNEDYGTMYNLSLYMNPLTAYYDDLDVIGIRTELKCPNGKYGLNSSLPADWHRLTRDGTLKIRTTVTNDYCIEVFDYRHCPENNVLVTALGCFVQGTFLKNFMIARVLNCMSAVCLALTLLVYCSLPELKNLHGKTLICHVSMMFLAYVCLSRVQFGLVADRRVCTLLGYGIYFGFVSAFAWLNVMCLDIWWTFGSMRIQALRKKSTDLRRFIYYSLYAWGVGVALTLITFLLDKYPVSKYTDANIGDEFCWFGSIQNKSSDWPHYIFFVVPMGLITCTNLVLWVLTARHCARVKSEVHRLQAGSVGDRAKRRFRLDRAKYVLTVKLWVVMGVGWIAELLSTLFDEPRWLWNILDPLNELQGVFIFLILVFKPKVYFLIKKKLGLEKEDPHKTTASSGRTSSTFLSRPISSDERAVLATKVDNGKTA